MPVPHAQFTTDVSLAASRLASGGLVAFATETVYGLGANAFDVTAVARVFEAKQRPKFDPLIVHLASAEDVEKVVAKIPQRAQLLMDRFWPGPLTLVLPKKECVPDLVTAGLPTVAVRVPGLLQARELIRLSGVPVAAPSANPFGQISPTTAEHVREGLSDRIDLILDGGACRVGVESTVLTFDEEERPVLLRAGGLSLEEIEAVAGPVRHGPDLTASETKPLLAPGMMHRHYAPTKPLFIVDSWDDVPEGESGILSLQELGTEDRGRFPVVEVLSKTGDLTEAAANFFAALRRLEASPVTAIFAKRFPQQNLGLALNDRLTRASARN